WHLRYPAGLDGDASRDSVPATPAACSPHAGSSVPCSWTVRQLDDSVTQGDAGPPSRRDTVFLVLTGVFITHAILGELIGGKLLTLGGWVMSIGVIPWPVVFVTTDLVNE